jgi:DNA-binding Lrp family transcriptional regulator
MALKPQDIYVALKIIAAKSQRAPYAQLAGELAMSPSEVHASVKRAQLARLLHGPELDNRPNLTALEEFLVHGLKYSRRNAASSRGVFLPHTRPSRFAA